jgi:amino acid transporter
MVRALLWGVGIITVIYLLINFAYLRGLGLKEMGQSEVVAADLMGRILGQGGVKFISFLIMVSALGAINASIFTGARTTYTLGQDFSRLGFLGQWHEHLNTPKNALLLQGLITLLLVLLGALARKGFVTMVEYTAPVFWCFFLLAGLSLFVLRVKEPDAARPVLSRHPVVVLHDLCLHAPVERRLHRDWRACRPGSFAGRSAAHAAHTLPA